MAASLENFWFPSQLWRHKFHLSISGGEGGQGSPRATVMGAWTAALEGSPTSEPFAQAQDNLGPVLGALEGKSDIARFEG